MNFFNGFFQSNLRIIDNLTDGGTDKVLSAEQGKILNTQIGGLDSYFDAGRLKIANLPNNVTITEYNADWIGTNGVEFTVDPDTDSFVFATDPGINTADPIEIDANGGIIPTGLEAYNTELIGTYYSAIKTDATHYKLSSTVAGSTPIDITSAGSGTFRIRKAGVTAFDVSGIDLLNYPSYELRVRMQGVQKAIAGTAINAIINNDTSAKGFTAQTSNGWASPILQIRAAQSKKYGITDTFISITRYPDGSAGGDFCTGGQMSDDRSTNPATLAHIPAANNYTILGLAAEVTSMRISCLNTANMLIRNGATVIARRIN